MNKLLNDVAAEYGFDDTMAMFETAMFDGVCPAVCADCGETMDLEPDGYCECECGGTIKSVLLIAGLI